MGTHYSHVNEADRMFIVLQMGCFKALLLA